MINIIEFATRTGAQSALTAPIRADFVPRRGDLVRLDGMLFQVDQLGDTCLSTILVADKFVRAWLRRAIVRPWRIGDAQAVFEWPPQAAGKRNPSAVAA